MVLWLVFMACFYSLFKGLFEASFMNWFKDCFGLKLWAVLWCYCLIM